MLMQLVRHHTQEKFVLLYVERWLKAGVEQEDGSIVGRVKGTPQGGVISPLLANIYLHHAFDKWMDKENPQCPFERYADDIVIHCRTRVEAEQLLERLKERMSMAELTLHPEKTKIVYCKNYKRRMEYENESFTFLGYSFQPRTRGEENGSKSRYLVFTGAISPNAKATIREEVRSILKPKWTDRIIESFAAELNPKIRGWINYYTCINRRMALDVFAYVNGLITQWLEKKYKLKGYKQTMKVYKQLISECPNMFYHWKLGIKAIR
jgi:group II intron reverse transcriptase/maturase